MPIPFDNFNKELEPKDSELLSKLEKLPYQAYTIEDLITKSENPVEVFAQAMTLSIQLTRLEAKGLVKSKNIGGKIYYVSAKAK